MRTVVIAWMVALGLSGCSLAAAPPPAPTADEAQQYYSAMLDKTWISTGLSGVMDRPRVEESEPVPEDEWSDVLVHCMSGKGFALQGFEWNPRSGYLLADAPSEDESQTSSDAQLAFYMCLAANPPEQIHDPYFLSPAQLDYVYDYYATWLIPCLAHHGWELRNAPTREEFADLAGYWSPYDSIIVDDVGDFEESANRCGPSRPALG